MKSKLSAVKNHVLRHRFAYGVGTGLAVGIYLNRVALEQHNEFLKENGLYDAFYTPID